MANKRNIEGYYFFFLSVGLLFLSSCSMTKGLKDGEHIYTGTTLEIEDRNNARHIDRFNYLIQTIPKHGTRSGFLNIYTGLYNVYDSTGDSGFKHWVKHKLGKAPVKFEEKMLPTTEARLSYFLNGKGFFGHQVNCDTVPDGKKMALHCKVDLNERYTIDTLVFPTDSTYTALKLNDRLKRAILTEGSYFDRDRLFFERKRLATMAGNIGFADLGVENIRYFVDTTVAGNKVAIYLKVIPPEDGQYHTQYTLGKINIYPNYTLNNFDTSRLKKVKISDNITVFESEHYLDHRLLDRMLVEETDTFYNQTNELRSINRFLDLGIFRFININNNPKGSGKEAVIEQDIFLTPDKIQSVSGEIELNNRSGNILGLGASVVYQHKNLFQHAENFRLSVGGQVEEQFGESLRFINSSDLNVSAELAFPRLIIPFIDFDENRNYVPRTAINSSYNFQRRIEYYTLESALGKYGFKWRRTKDKYHEFYPLVLHRVLVSDKTPRFEELLEEDARLRRSFDNYLIAGLQYYYTFSDQLNLADRRHKYFRAEIETSGNLMSLFYGRNQDEAERIFGTSYAQYIKTTIDYRRYFPVKAADIATRIIIGTGFAYGNSAELPYIKQYIVGGSNSIRAFPLRGVGPGAFVADPSDIDPFRAQFVDQTGDMKLEFNLEYRFPMFNVIKGALFMDAGNVWLINSDVQPDGNFRFDRFYDQIAIGAGFGLRLDFQFFLIRLDMAFPVREPVINEGFVWKLGDFDPFSASWRGNNIQYNLGIGYPF